MVRGLDKLKKTITSFKDEYEDNKVGTPMNQNEQMMLKTLTFTQKLEELSKHSKQLMSAQTFKQLFNSTRAVLKAIFRCESSFIFLRHKEMIE